MYVLDRIPVTWYNVHMSFNYDNEEVRDLIDNEGLSYFLLHYTNLDYIDDKEVRAAAKTAKAALENFQNVLHSKVEPL